MSESVLWYGTHFSSYRDEAAVSFIFNCIILSGIIHYTMLRVGNKEIPYILRSQFKYLKALYK